MTDSSYKVTYSFCLWMCMHDVALYLCSIFCSRSLVQFSTAIYRVLKHGTHPKLYPVTLNLSGLETSTVYRHGSKLHVHCTATAMEIFPPWSPTNSV